VAKTEEDMKSAVAWHYAHEFGTAIITPAGEASGFFALV
jgi:hypothetical protein